MRGVIAGSAEVIEFLRITVATLHLHRLWRPRRGRRDARRGGIGRSDEGGELFAQVLANAAYLRRGLAELGFRVLPPAHMADGTEIVTPVVPVVVGDDWKAVFLWKALYEAGVFVNVAIHPAVPPAGALLRTSVMATHDTTVLDEAIEIFRRAKQAFEAEHGAAPSAGLRLRHDDLLQFQFGSGNFRAVLVTENTRSSKRIGICDLAVTGASALA